jgi:hypothetical protein
MRASLYLIGFAAASIVGAGAAEIGCSSSSGGSSSPEDSGTADTSTPPADTGTTEDAGGDAATPCVTIDASAATIVTGSPVWDCYESMCATALAACAADCLCNDAVLSALQCTATDGGNQQTCFAGLASLSGAMEPAGTATLECLVGDASVPCQSATAPTGDGGTPDAAPATDAGDGG